MLRESGKCVQRLHCFLRQLETKAAGPNWIGIGGPWSGISQVSLKHTFHRFTFCKIPSLNEANWMGRRKKTWPGLQRTWSSTSSFVCLRKIKKTSLPTGFASTNPQSEGRLRCCKALLQMSMLKTWAKAWKFKVCFFACWHCHAVASWHGASEQTEGSGAVAGSMIISKTRLLQQKPETFTEFLEEESFTRVPRQIGEVSERRYVCKLTYHKASLSLPMWCSKPMSWHQLS